MSGVDSRELPFPNPVDESYRIFPAEIEDDPSIVFHGTSEGACREILTNGFKTAWSMLTPEERVLKPQALQSISFSITSPLALSYACKLRNPRGAIIAARVPSLDKNNHVQTSTIECSGGIVHLRGDTIHAEIVRYCIVPAEYRYI